MQRLNFLVTGAVACLAGLWLNGVLFAEAQPQRQASLDQSAVNEAPAWVMNPASTTPSGTLQFLEVYTHSTAPYGSDSHAVADFDRDGRIDLIIAEVQRATLTSRLVLLHNLGNWQFSAATVISYPTAGSYLYTIRAADLNQDQWPDLVLRNGCAIHVLLNDQLGGFITAWVVSSGYTFCGQSLALADMNDDKAIDILAGQMSNQGGRLDLFLNNGVGTSYTLTWQSPPLGYINGGAIHDIVVGDLNDDALPDIAASEIYGALLATFTGDGTGLTFTQVMSQVVGNRTYSMGGGNVNGDALTDVVLNTDGVVHAYTAQGKGTLLETWADPGVGIGLAQLLADFDRDGYDDFFGSSFWTGHVYVYLNRPMSGTFQLVWSNQLPGEIYSSSAANLDGDDYPDLIVGEDAVLHMYRLVNLTQRFFLPVVLRN